MATEKPAITGVALMTCGSYREAIQYYLHRLRSISQWLDEKEVAAGSCRGAPCSKLHNSHCERLRLRTAPVGDLGATSQCNSFFMRAFLFEKETAIADSQSTQAELAMRSAVVLFNIGLCFHMLSRESPDKQAPCQRQAFCFYEKSTHVIQAIEKKLENSVVVVCFAAMANMTSICESMQRRFALNLLIDRFYNKMFYSQQADCILPEEMAELKSIVYLLGFSRQCHAGAA